MTADAKPSNADPAADRSGLSTIDAVLMGPFLMPFYLPPLGLLSWGAYRLTANYLTAIPAPAVPIEWWQWPWGWPGARLVEALCAALGLPAASELSFSNPMLLFTDVEIFLRAILALLANCVVTLIPLYLSLLLLGTAARAYHWTRGDFVSR